MSNLKNNIKNMFTESIPGSISMVFGILGILLLIGIFITIPLFLVLDIPALTDIMFMIMCVSILIALVLGIFSYRSRAGKIGLISSIILFILIFLLLLFVFTTSIS